MKTKFNRVASDIDREIFLEENTNQYYVSINTVVRALGIGRRTINKFLSAIGANTLYTTRTNTKSGKRTVSLLSEQNIIDIAAKYNQNALNTINQYTFDGWVLALANNSISIGAETENIGGGDIYTDDEPTSGEEEWHNRKLLVQNIDDIDDGGMVGSSSSAVSSAVSSVASSGSGGLFGLPASNIAISYASANFDALAAQREAERQQIENDLAEARRRRQLEQQELERQAYELKQANDREVLLAQQRENERLALEAQLAQQRENERIALENAKIQQAQEELRLAQVQREQELQEQHERELIQTRIDTERRVTEELRVAEQLRLQQESELAVANTQRAEADAARLAEELERIRVSQKELEDARIAREQHQQDEALRLAREQENQYKLLMEAQTAETLRQQQVLEIANKAAEEANRIEAARIALQQAETERLAREQSESIRLAEEFRRLQESQELLRQTEEAARLAKAAEVQRLYDESIRIENARLELQRVEEIRIAQQAADALRAQDELNRIKAALEATNLVAQIRSEQDRAESIRLADQANRLIQSQQTIESILATQVPTITLSQSYTTTPTATPIISTQSYMESRSENTGKRKSHLKFYRSKSIGIVAPLKTAARMLRQSEDSISSQMRAMDTTGKVINKGEPLITLGLMFNIGVNLGCLTQSYISLVNHDSETETFSLLQNKAGLKFYANANYAGILVEQDVAESINQAPIDDFENVLDVNIYNEPPQVFMGMIAQTTKELKLVYLDDVISLAVN